MSAPAPKRNPIPFGKYLLLDRINIGGMAEVWRGKAFGAGGFERLVAIKRILPNIAEDEEFTAMFIDEAKISVQLAHANIAQTYDLGQISGTYYIAMEYVAGKDLRAVFDRARKRKETLPLPLVCHVMSKVCEGLDHAHRKKDGSGRDLNIVHRDVSPQNLLLSYDGEVKVIDFGIAKAAGRANKTQAGILKGKFGYMSPEQILGRPLDCRTDVFALGVCLHELLCGQRLFTGESDYSVLEKVRNVDIRRPSELNREIPPELEAIVLRALAREPADRYAHASDMAEDLQRFLITSGHYFGRKDLMEFMRTTFAEDLEKEEVRQLEYASVRPPAELLAKGEAPLPDPGLPLPSRGDPGPRTSLPEPTGSTPSRAAPGIRLPFTSPGGAEAPAERRMGTSTPRAESGAALPNPREPASPSFDAAPSEQEAGAQPVPTTTRETGSFPRIGGGGRRSPASGSSPGSTPAPTRAPRIGGGVPVPSAPEPSLPDTVSPVASAALMSEVETPKEPRALHGAAPSPASPSRTSRPSGAPAAIAAEAKTPQAAGVERAPDDLAAAIEDDEAQTLAMPTGFGLSQEQTQARFHMPQPRSTPVAEVGLRSSAMTGASARSSLTAEASPRTATADASPRSSLGAESGQRSTSAVESGHRSGPAVESTPRSSPAVESTPRSSPAVESNARSSTAAVPGTAADSGFRTALDIRPVDAPEESEAAVPSAMEDTLPKGRPALGRASGSHASPRGAPRDEQRKTDPDLSGMVGQAARASAVALRSPSFPRSAQEPVDSEGSGLVSLPGGMADPGEPLLTRSDRPARPSAARDALPGAPARSAAREGTTARDPWEAVRELFDAEELRHSRRDLWLSGLAGVMVALLLTFVGSCLGGPPATGLVVLDVAGAPAHLTTVRVDGEPLPGPLHFPMKAAVPVGRSRIEVSAAGFRSSAHVIEVAAPGDVAEVRATLEPLTRNVP